MTADTGDNTRHSTAGQVADDAALKREQQARRIDPQGIPVKQHNPGEQGINPDQRGPAQPRDEN